MPGQAKKNSFRAQNQGQKVAVLERDSFQKSDTSKKKDLHMLTQVYWVSDSKR